MKSDALPKMKATIWQVQKRGMTQWVVAYQFNGKRVRKFFKTSNEASMYRMELMTASIADFSIKMAEVKLRMDDLVKSVNAMITACEHRIKLNGQMRNL